MASNSFGYLFKYTSWGESHGDAIGCVIDGVPSGINLDVYDIQKDLDKRRPGLSYVSQRRELDQVKILSGVFDGKTTGTPISLIIYNQDHRPQDYKELSTVFRPGHADYVYKEKYGVYDYRGGGRASARETAMRVAVGAVAKKILGNNISIKAILRQIGQHTVKEENIDWKEAEKNPFFCPDKNMIKIWERYLDELREQGDSVGALIELKVEGVPIGLGEPVYNKLDANIASAIMGINAVKSVEIGCGIKSASLKGSEYIDEMSISNNKINFSSNNSGGIVAGISTSQPILIKFAVRAPSSIRKSLHTINHDNENINLSVKGRHDVCVGIRAIPVAQAMVACVLADFLLLNKLYLKREQ